MRRFSAFAVAREAMRSHKGWEKQWDNPEPKSSYDVIIVGAGGHGLATAYYLASEHGITNIERVGSFLAVRSRLVRFVDV